MAKGVVCVMSCSGMSCSGITSSSAIDSSTTSLSVSCSSTNVSISTGLSKCWGVIVAVTVACPVWIIEFGTASMPVATTETRMMPSIFSSNAEPKIIVASESTSRRIWFAASSTSNSVISLPPVMLIRTACAPFILVSSNNGLLMAASAAFAARFSPDASPVPIMALPISDITVRISAKSRLILPGFIIRSVTPHTPLCRTSSAIAKASANVVRSFARRNRFWFGMIIKVST